MIRKKDIYIDKTTEGVWIVLNVENDYDGSILNIKLQNENNKSLVIDVGDWELENLYYKKSN